MSTLRQPNRLTLRDLKKMHRDHQKIAMLTAYDYVMAGLLDQSGLDLILVGDSLGNVVLGFETTIPVTLEDMIHHCSAVVRGTKRALIVCDLPFGAATDPESALASSVKIFKQTQCQAVKIEGGLEAVSTVQRLTAQGIPVMAHIGLTPQSVHQMGGYFTHGKSTTEAQYLLDSALALEKAGAFAIVLECITAELSAQITQKLSIPTIGIGSGESTSGQVLVINDLIGLSLSSPPSFVKPKANIAPVIRQAVQSFVNQVKDQPQIKKSDGE